MALSLNKFAGWSFREGLYFFGRKDKPREETPISGEQDWASDFQVQERRGSSNNSSTKIQGCRKEIGRKLKQVTI